MIIALKSLVEVKKRIFCASHDGTRKTGIRADSLLISALNEAE
jgi:hypothetical protein